MKLYELTPEQYEKWCETEQGKAFDEELQDFILLGDTALHYYNVILKAKEMFEREVTL